MTTEGVVEPKSAAEKPVQQEVAAVKPKAEVNKMAADKPAATTASVRKPLQAGQIRSFADVVASESGGRAKLATAAPAKPEPKSQPSAKPLTAGSGSAWVIQAGVFSSNDNARQLVSKLRAGGMAANVVPVRNGSTTLYRVTVGPDVSRAKMDDLVPKVSQIRMD